MSIQRLALGSGRGEAWDLTALHRTLLQSSEED